MKRITCSGSSAVEMLLLLIIIGVALYYGVNAVMPAASSATPGELRTPDLPAAATIQTNALNNAQAEQQKAIDEMIGKRQK